MILLYSIYILFFLTFQGQDFNILATIAVMIVYLLNQKPEPEPCKILDFCEYKAKRDAMKMNKAYRKAA